MQITVFGASGKIGRRVVPLLLNKGYDVVAFVHNNPNFEPNEKLKVAQGDVHTVADVAAAIQGSDVVISALGSWHTKSKDILTSAMQIIVPAMEKQGIKRIITLTGADAIVAGDKTNLVAKLMRPALKTLAGKILFDGEEHIRILEASNLNFSVVRSPVMRSIGSAGNFKLNMKPLYIWNTVNRKDVADAISYLVDNTEFERACPFLHS
jgi:putative NADH-flavin reductase